MAWAIKELFLMRQLVSKEIWEVAQYFLGMYYSTISRLLNDEEKYQN